jgi:hypothetical protein
MRAAFCYGRGVWPAEMTGEKRCKRWQVEALSSILRAEART